MDDPGVGGVVGGNVLGEELEVELDGGEGVLDFVGEAAGQGAELGESLSVTGAALEEDEPAVGVKPGDGGEGETCGKAQEEAEGEGRCAQGLHRADRVGGEGTMCKKVVIRLQSDVMPEDDV